MFRVFEAHRGRTEEREWDCEHNNNRKRRLCVAQKRCRKKLASVQRDRKNSPLGLLPLPHAPPRLTQYGFFSLSKTSETRMTASVLEQDTHKRFKRTLVYYNTVLGRIKHWTRKQQHNQKRISSFLSHLIFIVFNRLTVV